MHPVPWSSSDAAARLRGRTVLPWDRSWEQGSAVRHSMQTTILSWSLGNF